MIVRCVVLVALLAMLPNAAAQVYGFGARYDFGGDLTANLKVEFPSFDVLGLRAGPSVSVNGRVGPGGTLGAGVVAGVTLTYIPTVPGLVAFAVDLDYRVVWTYGDGARASPGIGIFATWSR